MCWVDGVFEGCITKEAIPFWVKCGMDKDQAEKMAGVKMTYTIKTLAPDAIMWKADCDFPDACSMGVFVEGKEAVIKNKSFGDCKLSWKKIGPNKFENHACYEKYGSVVFCETFCAEGCNMVYTSKDHGVSYEWKLKRVVDIDGSYRLVKATGVEKCSNVSDDFPNTILQHPLYKFKIIFDGEQMTAVHTMPDGQSVPETFKLGEESVSDFDKNISCLLVQISPNTFSLITKNTATGVTLENISKFCGNQIIEKMKDLKTGATADLIWEKFTDITGIYKIVSFMGMEDYNKALGIDPEMMIKLYTHPNARYHYKEVGNTLMGTICTGEEKVFETCTTYDEEVTQNFPLYKDVCKTIASKTGNAVHGVMKTGPVAVKFCHKKTKNFVVSKMAIVGTDIQATIIYMEI